MNTREANFDGLVGPSHNYAGLSFGNLASMNHKALVSNPREAALQGLRKMRALSQLGLVQGVLPPHERPDVESLRRLGFSGSDTNVLQAAYQQTPELLAACASASAMWTANAATVSPSVDSEDGRVHFTPANLISKFHRSIEPATTSRSLRAIFKSEEHFAHHPSLPSSSTLGDEGAANHTRLYGQINRQGLQLFVYGRAALKSDHVNGPKRFPARQTLEASQAVARLHKLRPSHTVFIQQNPDVIDAGAFHNDVVAVGNGTVLFHHEMAFHDSAQALASIREAFESTCQSELIDVSVSSNDVPLNDAIRSYLFNSQLVTLPNQEMCLIAPSECQEVESVHRYVESLIASGKTPIRDVRYFDLRQSMQNGGGPACLRLRVTLNDSELQNTNQSVLMSDRLYTDLESWIQRHYRDRLTLADIADPKFLTESRTALDELTETLGLGSIYSFQ